jgi:hypothetical protein
MTCELGITTRFMNPYSKFFRAGFYNNPAFDLEKNLLNSCYYLYVSHSGTLILLNAAGVMA